MLQLETRGTSWVLPLAIVLTITGVQGPIPARAAPGLKLLGQEAAKGSPGEAARRGVQQSEARKLHVLQALYAARYDYSNALGGSPQDLESAQSWVDGATEKVEREARSELELARRLGPGEPFLAADHISNALALAKATSNAALLQEIRDAEPIPVEEARAVAKKLFQESSIALVFLYGQAPGEEHVGAPKPQETEKQKSQVREAAASLRSGLLKFGGQDEAIGILDAMMRDFESLPGRSDRRWTDVGPDLPEFTTIARFLANSRKLAELIGVDSLRWAGLDRGRFTGYPR